MVAPERTPLSGLVEADETTIPFRTMDDLPAGGQRDAPTAGGQGRRHDGKLLLIGAVEVVSGRNETLTLGRLRLVPIADVARNSPHAAIAADTAPRQPYPPRYRARFWRWVCPHLGKCPPVIN